MDAKVCRWGGNQFLVYTSRGHAAIHAYMSSSYQGVVGDHDLQGRLLVHDASSTEDVMWQVQELQKGGEARESCAAHQGVKMGGQKGGPAAPGPPECTAWRWRLQTSGRLT